MRKRNHVIPVHLNAKELRYLDDQVKKSGFSREEYLRSMIMGAEVRAKPCEHHADLLRKIAGLCNNANQLARAANTSARACGGNAADCQRDMENRKGGMVGENGIHQHYPGTPSRQFHPLYP